MQRYWDGTAWTAHSQPLTVTPPAETSGKAVLSLVFGIASLLFCGAFITGIPAMILARMAKKDIQASQGRLTGEGIGTAGFVTGLIGTIVGTVGLALVAGLFIFGSTVELNSEFQEGCIVLNPDGTSQDC